MIKPWRVATVSVSSNLKRILKGIKGPIPMDMLENPNLYKQILFVNRHGVGGGALIDMFLIIYNSRKVNKKKNLK